MFVLTLRQINQLVLSLIRKPVWKDNHLVCAFRCWPVDLDIFLHMNNAMYARIAELASWRILKSMGFLKPAIEKGWAIVVAEQKVTYLKQIKPFQRYEVRTRFRMENDKHVLCQQTFWQLDEDVQPGKHPIHFATVDRVGILKDRKGKTIRAPEFPINLNEFFGYHHKL